MNWKQTALGLLCILAMCCAAAVGSVAEEDIYQAVKSGDAAAVTKLLQQNKAAVNARDTTPVPVTVTIGKEWTPLHWAAFTGHADVAEVLIKNGADVNARDAFGYTPLHFAMSRQVAAVLVEHGAKTSAQSNSNGWTPLHRAAFASNKDVVQYLISEGADVNARDRLGNPALYYAAGWSRSREVAQLLIQRGADINAADKAGWTPLHCAAYAGDAGMVKLLLSKGAQVNARDDFNRTPLQRAQEAGRTEIVKILKAAGGK